MVAIINGTEKMVPDFCFLKLDLWFLEPVQIEDGTDGYWGGKGKLKVFLLALKHSRRPEVLSVLHRIIRIAEEARSLKSGITIIWMWCYSTWGQLLMRICMNSIVE